MTELEMTGWLLKAANYGITGIKVYYEGGGDSGAIEYIVYTTDPLEDDEDAFDTIESLSGWGTESNLSTLDLELHTAIDNFAIEHVLDNIEDWWNNEGGYGSLCIMVPSGKYRVFNNIRVIDYESYEHDGKLIDETLK